MYYDINNFNAQQSYDVILLNFFLNLHAFLRFAYLGYEIANLLYLRSKNKTSHTDNTLAAVVSAACYKKLHLNVCKKWN